MVANGLARADEFNIAGAAELFRAAAGDGCTQAEIAALYLRGLVDARDAFRQGGTPASLAPVRQAIASLDALARRRPGPAEIARLTLHAAAAAAQSERDDMRVYLESAIQMEVLQRAAGQPGAPVIAAAETAGNLWLQVHRYEDARRSYNAAAEQVGLTRRVIVGLARVAARLNDVASACANYRMLLTRWGLPQSEPSEIVEARHYFAQATCQSLPRP